MISDRDNLVYAGSPRLSSELFSLLKTADVSRHCQPLVRPVVLGCGIALFLIGETLPVGETQIQAQQTELMSMCLPYQFEEFHSILVHAPRRAGFPKAIQEVSADEISLFRMLTWIRRRDNLRQESVLNAPPPSTTARGGAETGFMKLAEDQDREIVIRNLGCQASAMAADRRPLQAIQRAARRRICVAAINFRIQDEIGGFSC